MAAELLTDKEHDQAELLGNDDATSLSSITSLTLTESSQNSNRSNERLSYETDISTFCAQHETMVTYFNKFFEHISHKLNESGLLHLRSEVHHIATLFVKVTDFNKKKTRCLERTHQSTLKDLKTKMSELETEKESLLAKLSLECKNCKFLKNVNDSLNEYIEQAELYHVRQVGELKAKISLTRIEDELNSEVEICAENSKNSNTTVKTKKSRRSSFKFWKKTSSHSIGAGTSPSSKYVDSKLAIDQSMKTELEEKSIKIEELVKYTNDLEKKASLLQITLQNKDIEANKKEKRIDEMKDQIKSMKNDNSQCSKLFDELNEVLLVALKEVRFLELESKARRQTVVRHREQLGAVDWNIKRLNEENKIILSRINKKNYEVNLEKLKTNAIVKEMKGFLTNFLQKFQVGKTSIKKEFEKHGLTKLVQISNAFLNNYDKNLCVPSKKTFQHKSIQTSPVQMASMMDSWLADNSEMKQALQQNCFNISERTDSGLALNDLNCIIHTGSKRSLFQQFDGELLKDHLEEKSSFSKEKENHHFKQNLFRLEKENGNLKKALSESRRGVQILEKHLNHKRTGFQNSSETNQKWRERNQDTSFQRNVLPNHAEKSNKEYLLLDFPQRDTMKFKSNEIDKDYLCGESDSFLHSYEVGSSLIRDILEEKEQLEQELMESRLALKHGRQKSPQFI